MEINQSNPSQKALLHRLHRIEGQVHGVQEMVMQERSCEEVLQQLSAIRSAITSTMQFTLEEYAAKCMANLAEKGASEQQQVIKNLLKQLTVIG